MAAGTFEQRRGLYDNMLYRTKCRVIWINKWYIVDTFQQFRKKPHMLQKPFDNKKQALASINRYWPGELRFDIIKGSRAIEFGMYPLNRWPNLRIYLVKYNYPKEADDRQSRKSYRTKFRRQNRNKQKSGEFYKKWG